MEEKTFCVAVYLKTKSLKSVQAKYPGSFNFNKCLHKFQVSRWENKFKGSGSLIESSDKRNYQPASGRKLTARFPENVDAVRHLVGRSLKKSIRKRRLQVCKQHKSGYLQHVL